MNRVLVGLLVLLFTADLCMAQSRQGDFTQRGMASQEMQTDGLSAAHPSLPVGSRARVTNVSNGKEIEVTITGRIPSSSDRIIDLSPGSALALELGFRGEVIINVPSPSRPSVTPTPPPPPVVVAVAEPEPPTLERIAITRPPSKIAYQIADPLDLTGLEVTATYSDGTREIIARELLEVGDFDSSVPGTKIVNLAFSGKEAAFFVNVESPPVVVVEPPPPPPTYTVTFDSEGGSRVRPVTVNEGDRVASPDNPTKDNYIFVSWHKEDGNDWDFGRDIVTGNMTLYANWGEIPPPPAYTVTFDSDGGSRVRPLTVNDGDRIASPDNPVKDGYIFASWSRENGNVWDFGRDVVTNHMTLYANWGEIPPPPAYTVTFDSDGGSRVRPLTVNDGDRIASPSNPVKDNHIFVSWTRENGNDWDFGRDIVTGNMTLYANWDALPPPPPPEPTIVYVPVEPEPKQDDHSLDYLTWLMLMAMEGRGERQEASPQQPLNITIYNYIATPEGQPQEAIPEPLPLPPPPPAPEPEPPITLISPLHMYDHMITPRVIPGYPDPNTSKSYRLQVGAYFTKDSADQAARLLQAVRFDVVQEYTGTLYRVLAIGIPAPYVYNAIQRIGALGFTEVWVRE